ncbi:unnamed protein product [Penicillium nalgiovense]|nr:unnamed protein product [Penicillium nalgiovense]
MSNPRHLKTTPVRSKAYLMLPNARSLSPKTCFIKTSALPKGDEVAPCGRPKTSVSKRQLAPTLLFPIPSVYFNKNLHLENPRIVDVVSEHTDVVRQRLSTIGEGDDIAANGDPQPTRKTLTTYNILQEKLPWYMDTVEIHLVFSISQASASFFSRARLRELQTEAADSVAKIRKLRKDLAHLNKDIVVRGFEVISSKRRRDNLTKLGEATKQLQCVLSGASHCEKLVNSGHLETAMQHISYVEQLASGTLDPRIGGELHWLLPNPFIRLPGLRRMHAIGGLLQDTEQIHLRIGKDTLTRWTKRTRGATDDSTSISMMEAETLREELIPVLQGLGQSQYLAAARTTFREADIREMKSLIRQHLPSFTNDDSESATSASVRSSGRRPT